VFGADPGHYHAALAGFGPDGDRRGWLDFLGRSRAIFEAHGDIPFVHWHHYETTKVRAYLDRYGDDTGVAERVLRNCVDLLPITRDAVVLPDASYSLKVVERRAGYRRTLDEYGGDWSIARFIEAVETEDEAARESIMQEILHYNREDLEATWAVVVWLRSLA
jgi:predicted RecB family nuclease